MASNTSIPIIVQGNSFALAIPLQIYIIDDNEMVLQDYTPDPTDEVSIQLKGSRRNYTYTPTIDGNVANINLGGYELADNYAVVVSIVKANGQRLRSFRTDQFFIVESSDDLTQDDIIAGLEENVIYLNAQAFIAGADGRGITSIVKTSTSGLVDTYTITYTDNTTSTFQVTNGANGQQGADGVGIVSIEKTSTSGLVDTYTITLSNGNTSTFEVTNGQDAHDLGLAVIVNNLTTGGIEDALSAEMGKELGEEMGLTIQHNMGEIINLADLSNKVKGVYKGGVLITAGYWEGNSSSIKVAVEPNTHYLIGSAFYGGSIPRYIGEWDENGTWLRDIVANNVGVEGSEYATLANNIAFIKTSADSHFISIAFLTSAYSASNLAPTMVVNANRVVMPSTYIAYGIKDTAPLDTASLDSMKVTNLDVKLSQMSKECFAVKYHESEFTNNTSSTTGFRLNISKPRMLVAPLGRALTTGDVVKVVFDAKLKNYSGGSVQGYTEILRTAQSTASTGTLDSKSERTNYYNGDWGQKEMSITLTSSSNIAKLQYAYYTLNFYNVVAGTMMYRNIKLYVNDVYQFDFDSSLDDNVFGQTSSTMNIIDDERDKIATKRYVDGKTATANNWYQGKNWLAFGDSITAPSTSYAMVTAEALGMTCENAGVSGYTSGNVLNQALPLYAATLANYDVITVQIGTNDFANNVTIADFKSNLRSIFNTILGATVGKVYVAATPIRRGDISTNTLGLTLDDYVDAFIEISNECGWQLIDQFYNGVTHFDLSNWQTSGLVSPSDLLHPTASGQQLIAQQWKSWLTSHR